MNIKTYKKEIIRTWNADHSQDLQICNATLGLVGEVGEFERTHTMDELGDVAFYTWTLARLLGHEIDAANGDMDEVYHMGRTAAGVAEQVKKLLFHDLGQMRHISAFYAIRQNLNTMALTVEERASPVFGEVLAGNIYKLRQRHPDGFSSKYMDEK